jgi:hypothetical protein
VKNPSFGILEPGQQIVPMFGSHKIREVPAQHFSRCQSIHELRDAAYEVDRSVGSKIKEVIRRLSTMDRR